MSNSEGRRVLLAVLQRIRAREVALRVHVTPAAVSWWTSGRYRPSTRSRALLERHCRIEARLWDLPVRGNRPRFARTA